VRKDRLTGHYRAGFEPSGSQYSLVYFLEMLDHSPGSTLIVYSVASESVGCRGYFFSR
jgi:hypothetical protein